MRTPFKNFFVKPTEEYTRDINVLKHYAEDSAEFLAKSTGRPLEECKKFISESLRPGGQFAFTDPKVSFLQRNEVGDRVKSETTLSRYINESLQKKELIAPTLTTYVHPSVKESLLAKYVDGNIKARSLAKKAMFAAKAIKDFLLEAVKKVEQTMRKLANNAISGAHVSPSTPLHNKTAHSTLTSTCRSTSGYGNANNEKFLCGNRHYFTHHIVLQNIISICRNTDFNRLQLLMDKYKLYYPTCADVEEMIKYSTSFYWREKQYFAKIVDLVSKLTPLERAAFVYTGDLYHLMKHNEELVRGLIGELASKITGIHPDPAGSLKVAPDDHINLAHQICAAETAGIGKDYSTIKDKPAFHTLALTVDHIADTITKYGDLIETLWVTINIPASVAHFPDSIRRSALTSDTDSTIFTVQDWVIWYKGKISFDPEATAVAATMIFLASSTITHVLAIMSANFGIVQERLHQIAMKNEFKFDIFVPTQLGKHYFAAISCQEGNVFTEHETEIKGVYLKSSNAPREIIADATAMMEGIMETVMKEGKLSLTKYLKHIADVERKIIKSIQAGEFDYLRSGSIKDAGSYTADEESSPYAQHAFWNDVFGPKYGTMPEPPYQTYKVSIEMDNAAAFKAWIDSIKDRELATRLENWAKRTGKTTITTLNLPAACLQSRGMPEEVLSIIAYRKIITDITKIYYIVLETLGMYSMEKKVMRLMSDSY